VQVVYLPTSQEHAQRAEAEAAKVQWLSGCAEKYGLHWLEVTRRAKRARQEKAWLRSQGYAAQQREQRISRQRARLAAHVSWAIGP
jgi:hypothetical protein